jgi:hypothetical protein
MIQLRQAAGQLLLFFLFIIPAISLHAQVSLPERNPLKLTFRGGVLSNNNDQAADLQIKSDGNPGYSINTDYAALGEVELAADLIHFRGAGFGIQVAALYAHPELKATAYDGTMRRVGLTDLEMVRMNITFSFNGFDPYTMFELPYHSNKEAVLGITGMITRTQRTQLNSFAKDSLGIKSMDGEYCQAMGVTFGWNWRLGESAWVLGVNGAVMFVMNESYLVKVETEESSPYTPGRLEFAPRLITAGLGYHF